MGVYKVTHGQSLYDVALHIYGSVEGITDLLVNNESLSLADRLMADDELIFSDGYIINKEVVAYYSTQGIIPSTGELKIYPKYPTLPKCMEIYAPNNTTTASFAISGSGKIEVDWGDNSPLELIKISNTVKTISHVFDSKIKRSRKVTIYMDCTMKSLDISGLRPQQLYILRPIYVERFHLSKVVT